MKGTDSIKLFVNTAILFCKYLMSLYSHLYSSCDLFSSHHVVCCEWCWSVYPECDIILQIWHYTTNMILHYLWQILLFHLIFHVILIHSDLHLLLYSLYRKINNLFLYFITAASAVRGKYFLKFFNIFDILIFLQYFDTPLRFFLHSFICFLIIFLFVFIFWLVFY